MENLANNYLGYNTYILGTTKSIIDCLGIILYNKDELLPEDRVEKISIYNIERVIRSLESCRKYLILRRSSATGSFEYLQNNNRISGFNVIIYLRNGDSAGIGYTEFLNIQGQVRDININLDFNTSVDIDLNIDIANSLAMAKLNNPKQFLGDDLQDYTSAADVINYKKSTVISPSLFTTHLSSFGDSVYESNIWLGSVGALIETGDICNLKIFRNFDADPYNNRFTRHQVGYYQGSDICYYTWDGLRYSIFSLSLANRFGTPTSHTQSSRGYLEVKGLIDASKYEIKMFSGRYAIIGDSSGKTKIYDTVSEKLVVSESGGRLFIDDTNQHYKIYELPQTSYYNNIITFLPDLSNTFFNIENFGRSNYINIFLKTGDWYIFSQGNYYIYSNLRQSITIHKSEFDRVLIINDLYLGVLSEDHSFLTCYTGIGENWETEIYKESKGVELIEDNDLGIKIANDSEYSRYKAAYQEGRIRLVDSSTSINSTWLSVFRRNNIPNTGYPNISSVISSLSGLIFYIKEGKLNYL